LAELPDHCTVYQINIRVDGLERDLDCCLMASDSPIVATYPDLDFRLIMSEDINHLLGAEPGVCFAYYESAACSMQPTEDLIRRNPEAIERMAGLCGAAGRWLLLDPIAEEEVSSHSTGNVFGDVRPTVRLYRWTGVDQ
jgi:hypothetical protein